MRLRCLKGLNMDERPWFKSYDSTLPRTLRPYPDKTILDVIGETVRERPDHPALIFKGSTYDLRRAGAVDRCLWRGPGGPGRQERRSRGAALAQLAAGRHRASRRLESRRDCLSAQCPLHRARIGIRAERNGRRDGRRADAVLHQDQSAPAAHPDQARHRHQHQRIFAARVAPAVYGGQRKERRSSRHASAG